MDTEILSRDGWKCQFCGSRNNLHVHHIKYRSHPDENTEDPSNKITLCWICHRAEHEGHLVVEKKQTPKGIWFVVFRKLRPWPL